MYILCGEHLWLFSYIIAIISVLQSIGNDDHGEVLDSGDFSVSA